MDKKVTVITATYNYGHFIEEAVESVLNQTFKDFEYIIIDDGSKDDTPHRLKKYLDRIHYIHQENQGQIFSFNKALSIAQGEYVAFLDADDKWDQDFLKKTVQFLNNHPAEMVFCDFSSFDSNGIKNKSMLENIQCFQQYSQGQEFIFEECLEKLIQQNFIFPSCVLVKRSIFDHLEFEQKIKFADYDFFIRVALYYKIGVIMEVLTHKRDHQLNISSNLSDSMMSRITPMGRLLANLNFDFRLARLAKKRIAEAYYYWAYHEFKMKNYSYAAKLASSSLQASLSWEACKTWVYSFFLSLFFKGPHQ